MMSAGLKTSIAAACTVLVMCVFGQSGTNDTGSLSGLPGRSVLSDPPAVEDINAKASYSGGWMDSAEGHNFDASVSLPLSHAFGFQADGLYSRISGLDFYGGAGHLFWRNPELGLVGVAGGYLSRSGVDTFQVGAEAEYYLGRFSFGAFAGVGRIAYSRPVPFIETEPTRFVGSLRTDWYPFDELRVGACYMSLFKNNLVKADLEFQTPVTGLALTAEGAIGENDYDHVLFGVRYYFGAEKTLRDRHRRLDPRSLMPQILRGLGLYGAEYNRKAKAYIASLSDVWNFDRRYGCVSSLAMRCYGAIAIEFKRDAWLPEQQCPPLPPIELPPGLDPVLGPGGAFTGLEVERSRFRPVEITTGSLFIIRSGGATIDPPIGLIRPWWAQSVWPGFDPTRQLPGARPARELRPPIRPVDGGS